jgi:hypothetical protein
MAVLRPRHGYCSYTFFEQCPTGWPAPSATSTPRKTPPGHCCWKPRTTCSACSPPFPSPTTNAPPLTTARPHSTSSSASSPTRQRRQDLRPASWAATPQGHHSRRSSPGRAHADGHRNLIRLRGSAGEKRRRQGDITARPPATTGPVGGSRLRYLAFGTRLAVRLEAVRGLACLIASSWMHSRQEPPPPPPRPSGRVCCGWSGCQGARDPGPGDLPFMRRDRGRLAGTDSQAFAHTQENASHVSAGGWPRWPIASELTSSWCACREQYWSG